MYHVVSFPDTKEVEVVSSAWLSDDKSICYWPPFKASRVTNAVKSHLQPEDNWVPHKAHVLHSYSKKYFKMVFYLQNLVSLL